MQTTDFFESKYMRGADLIGKEITATIKGVTAGEFTADDGRKHRKPVVEFNDGVKPLVLNRTNTASLAAMFSDNMEKWAGKKILLYPDRVPFRGKMCETIRVGRPKPQAAPAEAPFDDDTGF
jgi:hypothetical protein